MKGWGGGGGVRISKRKELGGRGRMTVTSSKTPASELGGGGTEVHQSTDSVYS